MIFEMDQKQVVNFQDLNYDGQLKENVAKLLIIY
jgi:hypothetical protein